MPLLERSDLVAAVRADIRRAPVTVLLGPRQCGKTTLAQAVASASRRSTWFDLEDPELAR